MAQFNPADKIIVDVPLFIRLLEFAREDAKTDMDLHKITENAVALSETGKTLTMAQYDSIVKDSDGEDKPSVINQLDRAKLQPAQNQMNENKNKHMKTQLNELKRMQQLAGLINENEIMDDDNDYSDVNWNEVSLSSPEQDEHGITWVEMTDDKGSVYLNVRSIISAAKGEYNHVSDGDNQTYSITSEEAKNLLNRIK
jgi:hypothetical protein